MMSNNSSGGFILPSPLQDQNCSNKIRGTKWTETQTRYGQSWQKPDTFQQCYKPELTVPHCPDSLLSCQTPPASTPVPIFALHASGCHYLPLTVDMADISQQQRDILLSRPGDGDTTLHPVSIMVNFSVMTNK